MNRRALLGGVCSLGAVSGCVSSVESVFTADSGPIDDREFEVFEGGSDFFESISTDAPAVNFHQDGKRVEVIGKLCVGSSMKHKADLETSRYDSDSDTLIVHIGRERVQDGGTDDMSVDAYRARITFQHEFPYSVVAVELGQCAIESTIAHSPTDE